MGSMLFLSAVFGFVIAMIMKSKLWTDEPLRLRMSRLKDVSSTWVEDSDDRSDGASEGKVVCVVQGRMPAWWHFMGVVEDPDTPDDVLRAAFGPLDGLVAGSSIEVAEGDLIVETPGIQTKDAQKVVDQTEVVLQRLLRVYEQRGETGFRDNLFRLIEEEHSAYALRFVRLHYAHDPQTQTTLQSSLHHSDPEVQLVAAQGLPQPGLPIARALALDPNHSVDVRRRAVQILVNGRHDDLLLEVFRQAPTGVEDVVLGGLTSTQHPSLEELILPMISHPNESIVETTATILARAQVGTHAALPALKTRLKQGGKKNTLTALRIAIELIGERVKGLDQGALSLLEPSTQAQGQLSMPDHSAHLGSVALVDHEDPQGKLSVPDHSAHLGSVALVDHEDPQG